MDRMFVEYIRWDKSEGERYSHMDYKWPKQTISQNTKKSLLRSSWKYLRGRGRGTYFDSWWY